jgi:hypothetical protein
MMNRLHWHHQVAAGEELNRVSHKHPDTNQPPTKKIEPSGGGNGGDGGEPGAHLNPEPGTAIVDLEATAKQMPEVQPPARCSREIRVLRRRLRRNSVINQSFGKLFIIRERTGDPGSSSNRRGASF